MYIRIEKIFLKYYNIKMNDKINIEKIKKDIESLKKEPKKNYNKLLEIYKNLILEYYYLKKQINDI